MEKEKSHGKESVLGKLEKKKEESKTFAGTKKHLVVKMLVYKIEGQDYE